MDLHLLNRTLAHHPAGSCSHASFLRMVYGGSRRTAALAVLPPSAVAAIYVRLNVRLSQWSYPAAYCPACDTDDCAPRDRRSGGWRPILHNMSGSRAALPSPCPLRTVRESFPSHGSSLSLARLRTRLPYGQLAGMHLLMAGRM